MKTGQERWGKWILPGRVRECQPDSPGRSVSPRRQLVRQLQVMFTPSGGRSGEATSCQYGAGKVGAGAQVRDIDRGITDELDH
jgi:hypothetical protein